jgi:hypothetical protein
VRLPGAEDYNEVCNTRVGLHAVETKATKRRLSQERDHRASRRSLETVTNSVASGKKPVFALRVENVHII